MLNKLLRRFKCDHLPQMQKHMLKTPRQRVLCANYHYHHGDSFRRGEFCDVCALLCMEHAGETQKIIKCLYSGETGTLGKEYTLSI